MTCFRKQGFIITVLFSLLITVAVLPVAMLNYNQSRLIDSVSVMAVQPEPQYETSQCSGALERIKTLTEGNKVIVEKAETISPKQQTELVHSVEKQLSILQSMEVLPQFAFSEQYHASFSKRSYMDMQNPNNPINICQINISYSTLLVNVYMDMETSLLYEVSIYSESPNLICVSENPSAEGFLEYLHFSPAEAEKEGIQFDASGYCSTNTSKIFISVIQRHKNYDFGDSSQYIIVTKDTDNAEKESITDNKVTP